MTHRSSNHMDCKEHCGDGGRSVFKGASARSVEGVPIDLHFKYSDGDGLLHRAVIEGFRDSVAAVLDEGADVDLKGFGGYTPLQYAAKHGHLQIVELLLERGAAVNLSNDWEWTPLHHAVYYGRRKVVEVLLDAGADPSKVDNVYGWTPLGWAKNNHRIINMMRKRGIKL